MAPKKDAVSCEKLRGGANILPEIRRYPNEGTQRE